jgi:ribosomal protein S17
MVELRGIESCDATGEDIDSECQFVISKDDNIDIKPGDEVLIMVSRPEGQGQEYGVALRIVDKREAEENEILVQYGDRVFVGQKIPEFI